MSLIVRVKKVVYYFIFIIFSTTLSERTFSTYEFYKNLQDDITPAGLAFFQADWDKSLKQFYHNVLGNLINLILVFKQFSKLMCFRNEGANI